jgi:hypothetical protein
MGRTQCAARQECSARQNGTGCGKAGDGSTDPSHGAAVNSSALPDAIPKIAAPVIAGRAEAFVRLLTGFRNSNQTMA